MITRRREDDLADLDLQILRSLSEGRRSETVASDLGISVRTVERRISAIRAQLGAASTIAAVVVAVRRGLI
ncbi:LuxR C-terminal-related transcriptional regulator [Nocardioides sp. TF02-7]|uniref:LuxR C-terminal-related transcriptional regulator n=1 Tax=Nocardioides sp. TF02-7 TaxID=2917724 RepID=UPI001F06C828|nr:LuxR C-terminal-related transcriptional regulator [Nocardioides sp. TF02-7]UMG93982.1 LuxR C-terminal-related transcriptional regulator [Nocardioides sp. TF02-7]